MFKPIWSVYHKLCSSLHICMRCSSWRNCTGFLHDEKTQRIQAATPWPRAQWWRGRGISVPDQWRCHHHDMLPRMCLYIYIYIIYIYISVISVCVCVRVETIVGLRLFICNIICKWPQVYTEHVLQSCEWRWQRHQRYVWWSSISKIGRRPVGKFPAFLLVRHFCGCSATGDRASGMSLFAGVTFINLMTCHIASISST